MSGPACFSSVFKDEEKAKMPTLWLLQDNMRNQPVASGSCKD